MHRQPENILFVHRMSKVASHVTPKLQVSHCIRSGSVYQVAFEKKTIGQISKIVKMSDFCLILY